MLTILKSVTFLVLLFGICSFGSTAFSMTPEDYCKIHKDSGAPGTCTTKGDCAVITTNLGTEECKVCTDGGCELVDSCDECSE